MTASRVGPATLTLALAFALAVPAPSVGQVELVGQGVTLTLGGLVQPQYTYSSVDSATDAFHLRRARLDARVSVNDFIGGRILTEFGSGAARVLDGYVSFDFARSFNASFGRFKRAFDLFELPPPQDLPEIEKDGLVPGSTGCSDLFGICSYSRFTELLLFAGRDVGVRLGGTSGAITYLATVTNGTGISRPDENDRKSASGRLTVALTERLSVSGQIGLHDYVNDRGDAYAVAYGVDVEWGTRRDGLHVRSALVRGDNWRKLNQNLNPSTFVAFQGIATYYVVREGTRLVGVEPLARISFADPDTSAADDAGVLLTPGIMFYVWGRNRIGANLDVYSEKGARTVFALQIQSTLYY